MKQLKTIFSDCRIVGLAGIKSSGKTNNLIYLLDQIPITDKQPAFDVYFYGMDLTTTNYLLKKGFQEISELNHLVGKTNSLIILDEFQRLKLNDRRNKSILSKIVDFIYHNNNYLILSSPNIREFNTLIGGVIEKWLLKTVAVDQCINGSQLKQAIIDYKGRYKELEYGLVMPKNLILVKNKDREMTIDCSYVKFVDSKKDLINIFG